MVNSDQKENAIIGQLEQLNRTASGILNAITKPPNKTKSALEILATGVGILGILGIVDLIVKWLTGGA